MESLTEKMTFEQGCEGGEGVRHIYMEVRAFQAEATANAKALRQE